MSQPTLTPEFYEVERILQRGQSEGQRYYLVKWKGFSDEEATWEPEINLTGCKKAIDQFEEVMRMIESGDLIEQTKEIKKKKGRSNKSKVGQKTIPIANQVKVKEEPIKESTKEAKDTKSNLRPQAKSQIFLNKSSDSKNQLSQKEKSKDSGKTSKRQKDLIESCLDTSESIELEPTTAQTVPPNSKAERLEEKDLDYQSQQIKPEKFSSSKNKEKENLRLEHTKELMNVETNQMALQTKGSALIDITEKTEHMNSYKRTETVQNSESQNPEKVPENMTKKRILSSSQEPINILENQKVSVPRKTELKISNNISETFVSAQPKKEQRTILSIKREFEKEPNSLPQIQKNLPTVSQRSKLCEDEFEEFIFEIIDQLLPPEKSVKTPFKKAIPLKNFESLAKCPLKFIDLTKQKFMGINARFFSYVLSKDQVEMQDKNGDFIYSRIEGLIKGVEKRDGVAVENWICLMIDNGQEGNQSQDKESVLRLVRVDDLEESLWKKLFRRFIKIKN